MAATLQEIKKQILSHELKPVYVLHGEEGYFIDVLTKLFEENVIAPEDRDFNQYTLYATQVDADTIMSTARRVPMLSERQLVIVKEAQAVRADQINKLHAYLAHPVLSTVLVICFRGDKAKGKDLTAAMRKNKHVEVFESPKIRDYQIGSYIQEYIGERGLRADSKTVAMLQDFIGNDLSRLHNEIDKLAQILPPGATITPEAVERNIGVSKDFNSFEFIDALALGDSARALRIADYFRANPKAVALQMLAPMMFNLFRNTLIAHYHKDKSERELLAILDFKSPFQLKAVRTAMSRYSARRAVDILDAIRTFDVRSKGVGSRQDEHNLFRDLLFRIFA